jgi:hypothetical protein
MIEVLIGSNVLTLILLAMALRANWRWRQALSELGDRTRLDIRRASKIETQHIRNDNGGW